MMCCSQRDRKIVRRKRPSFLRVEMTKILLPILNETLSSAIPKSTGKQQVSSLIWCCSTNSEIDSNKEQCNLAKGGVSQLLIFYLLDRGCIGLRFGYSLQLLVLAAGLTPKSLSLLGNYQPHYCVILPHKCTSQMSSKSAERFKQVHEHDRRQRQRDGPRYR